jgi:bacteriocin-like protein
MPSIDVLVSASLRYKTQQPAQAPTPPLVIEMTDKDLEQVVGGVEQFSRRQSDAQKSVFI